MTVMRRLVMCLKGMHMLEWWSLLIGIVVWGEVCCKWSSRGGMVTGVMVLHHHCTITAP